MNPLNQSLTNIATFARTVPGFPGFQAIAKKMLDELIDKIGEAENHPLASLMETLGALIECYETQHFPEPASDPVGVLKFLMDEHGIKQGDLSEIGSQGVVSEILNRKRELNVRQIKTLSRRFNVSPAVFF